MNQSIPSRESLLSSLDSLEQICRKRMNNVKLIDDKELPRLIISIQNALYEYAGQHSIPELALIAAKFPPGVTLRQIPFVVDAVYYAVLIFYLIGCVAGLYWYLMMFFPEIVVIVIARVVITMVFSSDRRKKLSYISDVVYEAETALEKESRQK